MRRLTLEEQRASYQESCEIWLECCGNHGWTLVRGFQCRREFALLLRVFVLWLAIGNALTGVWYLFFR